MTALSGLPDLIESDATNLAGQTDENTGRGHLSHSEISTLLACKQKYDYSYEQRLEPVARREALTLGKCFQLAIEHRNPEAGYAAVLEDNTPVFSQDDEDKKQINAAIVRAAAQAYLATYTDRQQETQREYEYRIRLRNPWTGAYSRTFDLLGFADELAIEDGFLTLIENKFVGQISPLNIRKLPLDRQIALEAYGVWRATGNEVKKIRYRWTRKPSIRQRQGESVAEFILRLSQDYADRPDFYLKEEAYFRSPEDLVRIEAELWDWAEQIRHARKQKVWARNTAHCTDFGGCEFLPLCLGDKDADALFQGKRQHGKSVNHQQEDK